MACRNHMTYCPSLLILLHMKIKEKIIGSVIQPFQVAKVIVPDPTAVEATVHQTAI